MWFPRAVSVCVALLIGFGAVQAGDAANDQEKLQGSWEAVEIIKDGKAAPADLLKGVKITFAQDKMTLVGGKLFDRQEFRVKLDPAKKPKAIDLTSLDGASKGKVFVGIYQLRGDTVKLCVSNDPESKERPSEFAAKEGSKVGVSTFSRRVKP